MSDGYNGIGRIHSGRNDARRSPSWYDNTTRQSGQCGDTQGCWDGSTGRWWDDRQRLHGGIGLRGAVVMQQYIVVANNSKGTRIGHWEHVVVPALVITASGGGGRGSN